MLSKNTLYNLYIEKNLSIMEIGKILNTSYSTVYRHLKFFNIIKSKELKHVKRVNKFKKFDKEFWKKRNQKIVNTLHIRYGKNINNISQIPGIQLKTHSAESIAKAYETKKHNGTFNTSKDEEKVYALLKDKFKSVYRNYKSIRYPFKVDFYLPDLDLYIEYQGNWTHGIDKHTILGPYDEKNLRHKSILIHWKTKAESSKFYKNAVNTWTKRDPLKRKIAKENNLNWIEFFDLTSFMSWLKKQ